jgi:hypothetical protein
MLPCSCWLTKLTTVWTYLKYGIFSRVARRPARSSCSTPTSWVRGKNNCIIQRILTTIIPWRSSWCPCTKQWRTRYFDLIIFTVRRGSLSIRDKQEGKRVLQFQAEIFSEHVLCNFYMSSLAFAYFTYKFVMTDRNPLLWMQSHCKDHTVKSHKLL